MNSRILATAIILATPLSALGSTVAPIKVPKRQIQIVRTECLVVATEAKRAAQFFPTAQPHATEVWSRVSEDNNTGGAMTALFIPFGRDAIGYDAQGHGLPAPACHGAPPTPECQGWRAEFVDTEVPGRNQRHHFGFYYFVGAAGGILNVVAEGGTAINDYYDEKNNNVGDRMLAGAAENLGELGRANGVTTAIGKQIKNGFCAP